MINENIAKGKWKEIKGSIQKAWGKLTSDELDGAEGDWNRISGMIETKYGVKKEEARTKLNEMLADFKTDPGSNEQIRH